MFPTVIFTCQVTYEQWNLFLTDSHHLVLLARCGWHVKAELLEQEALDQTGLADFRRSHHDHFVLLDSSPRSHGVDAVVLAPVKRELVLLER